MKLKVIFSLLTIFISLIAYGQEEQSKKDSINLELPSYLDQGFFKEGKTVYIRVFETKNSFRNSHILISYGEGKTEYIELRNMRESKSSTNAIRIHYVLAKFLSQGYSILNSTASGSDSMRLTAYLLTKEEKGEEKM